MELLRWRPVRSPFTALVKWSFLTFMVTAALLSINQARAQSGLPEAFAVGVILPNATDANRLDAAVATAAAQGAEMAGDEFAFNAEMLGYAFTAPAVYADGPEAVVVAAQHLRDDENVIGIVGGFTAEEARALSEWSVGAGVPFINVGSSADALRGELCQALTFHVEPSAAMYLDAMAGWYVRSGLRNWYFLTGDDAESAAQHARVLRTLSERHFGAREAGSEVIGSDSDWAAVAESVKRVKPDLIVLLLPATAQLTALAALEAAGVQAMVTGFPYPNSQTRAFYADSRAAAPTLGVGHRVASWEATIDAYGARELNSRYRMTYGVPMDPSAWSVFQGVKILYEAAFFGGGTDVDTVSGYLEAPQSVFDVWKGIGTSFRSWDRQLRQSLYLAKIDSTSEDPFTLASLVGELPAIYMPGTEVVERLDQIGDLAEANLCR